MSLFQDGQTASLIARVLREHRRELSLTQQELAELAGTTRLQIVRLENGESTEYLRRLEAVLSAVGLELTVTPRTDRLAQSTAP